MLDLTRADAEGQCAKGPVGRGVRISADDRHARLGDAQFGPDHVDDPLILVTPGKNSYAELVAVLLESFELAARDRIGDGRGEGVGRNIMVGGGERSIRPTN